MGNNYANVRRMSNGVDADADAPFMLKRLEQQTNWMGLMQVNRNSWIVRQTGLEFHPFISSLSHWNTSLSKDSYYFIRKITQRQIDNRNPYSPIM